MNKSISDQTSLLEYLKPESELEKLMLADPVFLEGLHWGTPRFGHPEGKVVYHIREVLDNVDKLQLSARERYQLRIITFAHDTFKYQEHKGSPRDWNRHHSILAANYLSKLTDDPAILSITELHDEAYYCWRLSTIYSKNTQSDRRLATLVSKIKDFVQLYYLFFKCDTCTGDKNLASLYWVEENLPGITKVKLKGC